jgi:pyruvate dehydrogenase complex dehydrogenase (E1) component
MPNAEYHALLRCPAGAVRKALVKSGGGETDPALDGLLAPIADDALRDLVADVGGHDLASVLEAFAAEVEWILLDGLRALGRRGEGESLYLRLSTKPVDQSLALPPTPEHRAQVLRGGYRLIDARPEPGYVYAPTLCSWPGRATGAAASRSGACRWWATT